METDEVIIENEPLLIEENAPEVVEYVSVPVLDEIDLSQPAFIGFGISGAMCLISITVASLLRVFRRAG